MTEEKDIGLSEIDLAMLNGINKRIDQIKEAGGDPTKTLAIIKDIMRDAEVQEVYDRLKEQTPEKSIHEDREITELCDPLVKLIKSGALDERDKYNRLEYILKRLAVGVTCS